MSVPVAEEYWEEIGGKVLRELVRRLDTTEAADLPGTLLMRLAEQYLKWEEKKASEEEEDVPYLTALEAIDQEGIALESKIEILHDYIEKLEGDHTQAVDRLAELLKEQVNGNASPV